MRPIRDLQVAAPLLLVGLALFFGGGPSDSSVVWLGASATVAAVVLLAAAGSPGGLAAIVPLGLLGVWCAVSIAWSGLPDRSWDYANRAVLYALLAAVGLWASARTRTLAGGLALLLGAVIGWSLLGKVFPSIYDYGGPEVTRLRGPIGLWNQLALVTAYALALALSLRRLPGTLLAYLAVVALVLTASRGGVLTALLVCIAWLALTRERVESAATLLAAGLPAAAVAGIAYALPGITGDAQPLHVRTRDGLVFGAVLLVGAAVAVLLERLPRPRNVRVAARVAVALGILGAAALVVLVAVHGVGSGAVGNGGSRLGSTSSNFRFTWWEQAWHGFREHPLRGVGAGAFHLLNLRFRSSYLDFTIEPHDLPVQLLAEVGLVGLVLFALACVLLIRPSIRRSGHELALALFLPAFLVHSLVDVDWDFVAVAAPAFVAAGALAGRPATRRADAYVLLPAVGAALFLIGSFASPWLARRWSNDALAAAPRRAITLANRAHALDPLLVDPFWAKAFALHGSPPKALAQYVDAVHRQPKNPQTWLLAGSYAWDQGCPYLAYDYLEKYTELDPKARPSEGGDLYRAALYRVNHRQYRC